MSRLRTLLLAPSAVVLVCLVLVPLAIVAGYSLLSRGAYGGLGRPWTLESWIRLADPLYQSIFVQSIAVAGAATALCFLLGFPLALYISRAHRHKTLLLQLVMLPFWTSFLVRIYAWMFLLRDTGLVNTLLMATGVVSEPLPLLYNWGAVLLGLVYGHLPFMVLPVYAALERVDPVLTEAAADLGAKPLTSVLLVLLPLASPGVLAGCVLVFIASLGAYLTTDLLGGGKTILIGNVIQNQFTTARDWPFGAAISISVMALVMLLLVFTHRRAREVL